MTREEVERRFIELVAEEAGIAPGEVRLEHDFQDDLKMDSLSVVELLMAVQDEMGVYVPDEELESIRTVGDALSTILAKLGLAA
jgi:acyl carrier protein